MTSCRYSWGVMDGLMFVCLLARFKRCLVFFFYIQLVIEAPGMGKSWFRENSVLLGGVRTLISVLNEISSPSPLVVRW